MQIDLSDKVTRVLVQEYVNKICHFDTQEDLDWNVHKLIHTFDVVKMAQGLINHTRPKLSKGMQKHILDAAVLHDIGRCHEFKNGEHLRMVDHGKIGADLIKKYLPKMKIEAETTLRHNKLPSDKDPKDCRMVLNYVRDADMLANISYQIAHIDIWLKHIFQYFPRAKGEIKIDEEVLCAVKERRPVKIERAKERTFLNMVLAQLCWYYGLKTKAAVQMAQKEQFFVRFKRIICEKIVPEITPVKKQQEQLVKKIEEIFPDKLFQ